MKTVVLSLLAASAALAAASCACPRCPVDSMDGIGVAMLSPPDGAERGALASVLQLIAEETGPEDDALRMIDAALNRGGLVIGRFTAAPRGTRVFGYALLKDGRIALDDRYARGARPDSQFLARPAAWPLAPTLYAAGWRLVRGGTWQESIEAAAAFAGRLADRIERGTVTSLPSGTDGAAFARSLRAWRRGL